MAEKEEIALAELLPSAEEPGDGLGAVEGFIKSALSSTVELGGFDPIPGVKQYREDSPIAGFGSELLGVGGIYGGMWKASKSISKIDKLIKAATKGDAVILGRAGEEALRIAPLEMAASISRIANDEDVGESLGTAAINLGISAGVGGFVGLMSTVGTRIAGKGVMQAVDQNSSLTEQLRGTKVRLKEAQDMGDPELIEMFENQLVELKDKVRIEMPQGTFTSKSGVSTQGPAVTAEGLVGASGMLKGTKAYPSELGVVQRMFALKTASGKSKETTRLLTVGDGGMDQATLARVEKDFGITEDFEEFVQFPRHLTYANAASGAAQAARDKFKFVSKHFQQAEVSGKTSTFWLQEPNNGLFLVAKRVKGKTSDKDEWLFYKTDSPKFFAPKGASWADNMAQASAFQRQIQPKKLEFNEDSSYLKNEMTKEEAAARIAFLKGPEGSTMNAGVEWMRSRQIIEMQGIKEKDIGTLLAEGIGIADNALALRVRDFVREYLTPTQFQFRDSALGRSLWGSAKFMHDLGQQRATIALAGKVKIDKSFGKLMMDGPSRGGALEGMEPLLDQIRGLTKLELEQIQYVWRNHLNPGEAARRMRMSRAKDPINKLGRMTPKVQQFLKDAQFWDDVRMAEMHGMAESGIIEPFVSPRNHFGITRTWPGDQRVIIEDLRGNVVHVAAGRNRKEAQDLADFLMENGKVAGKRWVMKDPDAIASRADDVQTVRRVDPDKDDFKLAMGWAEFPDSAPRSPAFLKERRGVSGYAGENNAWTNKELADIMTEHTRAVERYISEKTVDKLVRPAMSELNKQDGNMARILDRRLDDLALKQGKIAEATNQVTDRILSGVLGKNSASKIVSNANAGMFHWMLGMGNVGFTAVNAMTFMITTLPQASMAMRAHPARLSGYYNSLPLSNPLGQVQGTTSVLDPVKMVKKGFQRMSKLEGEFKKMVERGAEDGVWDPRFVEEWVGENATKVRDIKSAFQSPGGMADWVKALSEAGPALGERFTRLHAFSTAYEIGADFWKLKGDDLYTFAKEFTNNSMFLYSTADRPRILSGPLGSGLGLFKNWQMHQMFWMAEYFGEAGLGVKNLLTKGKYPAQMAPLMWAALGTGGVGGLGAMPLASVADGASRALADKSMMETVYDTFGSPEGNGLADSIWMGLPATMGISMQSQNTAPFANPARDASSLASFVYMDRGKALWDAISTSWDSSSVGGAHPGSDPEVRMKLLKALAPKTFYRAFDVVGDQALNSWRTGNQLVSGMGIGESLLYSVGFTPSQVEKKFAVANELWNNQKQMRQAIQSYGAAISDAQDAQDWEEVTALFREAQQNGIDIGSVTASAQTRYAKKNEEQLERQFDPANVLQYKNVLRGIN